MPTRGGAANVKRLASLLPLLLPSATATGYLRRMNTQTVTVQVDPSVAAILQELQARADAQGLPLDLLLRTLAEGVNGDTPERPFYETASTEEWLKAFNEWVDSHDPDTPVILDDSREAIYGDDGR